MLNQYFTFSVQRFGINVPLIKSGDNKKYNYDWIGNNSKTNSGCEYRRSF